MKTSLLNHSASWLLFAAALGSANATPEMGPSGDAETAGFLAVDVRSDKRMAGSKVEITIENGIATLSGHALSLEQSERAAARALATDQVRAVVNRIEIIKPVASEATLAERVSQRLKRHPALDASRIQVIIDGRRAVLSGEIGSWDEQELAREIATEIPGLNKIDNRLTVTFDTLRTDPAIQAQIEHMVADDPLYSGLGVTIEVKDGVVRLAGTVGSTGEKNQLVHRAHVTGVTEVWADDIMINRDLAMEGLHGKTPAPETVLESLDLAISRDPRLKHADIHAGLDQRILTLTGTAPTEEARAAAESTARGLPGDWIISNRIHVANATAGNESPGRLASNAGSR